MDQAASTYPCPCCGYLVFTEPPGSYDICSICFWEDDPVHSSSQRPLPVAPTR